MRSALFVLLGFALGVFAIAGFADWLPSTKPESNVVTVRSQEIPEDVRSRIAMRLVNARKAPQDQSLWLLQRDVDQWMLTDPRGCIDWLHREGALGLVRREHLRDVFASAFQGDLATAIREALQIPNGRLRAEWIEAVFEEAQELDPGAAFGLMRHLPTYLRRSLGESIVENLAKKDPAKAWTVILNSRDSWYQQGSKRWQMHYDWASIVLRNWAEKDRSGLKAYLGTMLDAAKDDREGILIAQSLQDLATGSQADFVVELLAGRERNATLQNVWRNASPKFALMDPEAAVRLIQSESNPILRKDTAMQVAVGMAAKEPDRAMQIAKEYAGPNEYRGISMVIRMQASKDPKGAAMQAMAIENVLARTEATAMVAGAWIQSEPASLADFALKSAPPEHGASWLDILANMHSTGVPDVRGKPWVNALNDDARVRIGQALHDRLAPEAWARISKSFEPAR